MTIVDSYLQWKLKPCDASLSNIYLVLVPILKKILRSELAKRGFYIHKNDLDEKSHDFATDIIIQIREGEIEITNHKAFIGFIYLRIKRVYKKNSISKFQDYLNKGIIFEDNGCYYKLRKNKNKQTLTSRIYM